MPHSDSPGFTGRSLPSGAEVRGFALYVGMSEDAQLTELVSKLKQLVAEIAPDAQTHATVALAAQGAGGRDVDVVRLALGEPEAVAQQKQLAGNLPETTPAASGVTIDLSRKRVLLDDVESPLTYREFDLLKYLVLREGLTVAREEIIEQVWAEAGDEEVPNSRTVDVHVRRLRVKLAQYQDIVRTVRGGGYRFDRHADVHVLYPIGRGHDAF